MLLAAREMTPQQRNYVLPADTFRGTVAGVEVSYNRETEDAVRHVGNPELKKFLEDAAITAALSRGMFKVVIRSLPHTTTINRRGERIPAEMHITIDVGDAGIPGHVLCYGFNAQVPPAQWYDEMTHGITQWGDRATSSNASSDRRSRYSGGSTDNDQAAGPSGSEAQWVATGSDVAGQQWVWWDGTKYTNTYS